MLNEYDYMFGEMPEMIRIEKTDILKKAQNELWRSKFWEKSFFDVVNRHCYQSDYYLLKQPLTFNDVDAHLWKTIKKLGAKYKIPCKRETSKYEILFELGLSFAGEPSKRKRALLESEIYVKLNRKGISFYLLPYSHLAKGFILFDYQVVENILTDFCNENFSNPAKEFIDFLEYKKKLNEDIESLSVRSIDIAKSSIKSLYEASNQINKKIAQGYLFSEMIINKKEVRIMHKEFLDNPQILIQKLQKKAK